MAPYKLSDVAAFLGISPEELRRTVAGVEADLPILGDVDDARLPDDRALVRLLDLRSVLRDGSPLNPPPDLVGLRELLALTRDIEDWEHRAGALEAENRRLRTVVQKVVRDCVDLTQRLAGLRLARRAIPFPLQAVPPAPRAWYRRWLDRLLGGAAGSRRARRAA